MIHAKGRLMQAHQHEEMFSAQLEKREGPDNAPASEQRSQENGTGEGGLRRYEEEEIVTKPWPPLRW
jgi:hypothetical protein